MAHAFVMDQCPPEAMELEEAEQYLDLVITKLTETRKHLADEEK